MLIQDLRYGVRSLRRAPGFTLLAVLAMSLGIGSVTAVFSIVDAAPLKPLRFRDASRLVMIWDQLPTLGMTEFPTSPAIYAEYRARARSFEDIAAFRPATATLAHGGLPERIPGASVTAGLSEVMGATVALGRPISLEETQPGRPPVALIGDGLWRRRFGGDRGIVGGSMIRPRMQALRFCSVWSRRSLVVCRLRAPFASTLPLRCE